MKDFDLTQQIVFLQQRVDAMHRHASLPVQVPTGEEIEILHAAVEELRTCQEELSQQNEELSAVQQATEVERRRYEELFDFVPDGYLVTDSAGVIQQANRAAAILLSVPQHYLVRRPLALFVNEEERPTFRNQLNKLATGQQLQDWETRLKPRLSTPFPASITVAAIQNVRGERLGLRWLIRDISARKWAEEEVRKASQELAQRVAEQTAQLVNANEALRAEVTMRRQAEAQLIKNERLAVLDVAVEKTVHEIGNAFNNLSTTVQLQRRYLNTHQSLCDETLETTVEDLLQQIQRLNVIIHKWRLLAQQSQFHFEPTDLSTLVIEVLNAYVPQYTARRIAVTWEVPDGLPHVTADREKVKQTLLNVCAHAVNAMPTGGTLTVRVYHAKEHVITEVEDTGIGTPAGIDFSDLFTISQPIEIGLGLAIAQHIIVVHGGTMTYTSEFGKGTVFRLALPQRM